jgi:hypothetical protein
MKRDGEKASVLTHVRGSIKMFFEMQNGAITAATFPSK